MGILSHFLSVDTTTNNGIEINKKLLIQPPKPVTLRNYQNMALWTPEIHRYSTSTSLQRDLLWQTCSLTSVSSFQRTSKSAVICKTCPDSWQWAGWNILSVSIQAQWRSHWNHMYLQLGSLSLFLYLIPICTAQPNPTWLASFAHLRWGTSSLTCIFPLILSSITRQSSKRGAGM